MGYCLLCRQGIIFLILNYNHIKTTLRAADSSVAQRISSASGSSGSGSKSSQQQQQQQQQQPAPGAAAGGLGSAGAAAIKECEVRRGGWCRQAIDSQHELL
jgi:predicted lipid-binding transport protein (Tim44 family)